MSDHHSKQKSFRSKAKSKEHGHGHGHGGGGQDEDHNDVEQDITTKTFNTRDEKANAGKMFRDQLKKSIQDLEVKKKKYKKKLEEIAQQAETQDQDIAVLQNKVADEVSELNHVNLEIEKNLKEISRLRKEKEKYIQE